MAIFPSFSLRQYRPEKCFFFDILELNERLSRLKKQQVQKVEKLEIFPNGLTHSLGPKMTIFPSFVFLSNIGQRNVFYDILERKSVFLGYKNKKFRKSKN